MRRLAAALAVGAVVILGGLVGVVAPASASCAGTPSPASAMAAGDTVFVGTVVSTTDAGQWAAFEVEEVWSGHPSSTVTVKAGAPAPHGGTFSGMEDNRTYQPGTRYLVDASTHSFGPIVLNPGELADSGCSGTQAWSAAVAAQRPATARVVAHASPITILGALPDPTPAPGPSTWHRLAPWAVGGLVLVGFVGAVVLANRGWRTRDRHRTGAGGG